ncbi:aspartate-semialdehyde dehydrogenase [Parachlamydia sp. AcF125]|uniref:aspartate-semialdehyde dehydrogenase n=1 Tax=Parachlamydia sp. AcF125 TaxID=2795736 RepID=UPI001BC98FA6|nr:aspartate-semialdehyde dehydrogenase [Parachlamydia sp. AcF125]MBS4167922.1 Aspartate-semialdehyde dehydrogenase 2 [Parachlamydia sp. AcF125]
MEKIPVGILGATGMVGQHYLRLLENHPWFEVTFLCASTHSAGKTYQAAVEKRWHMPTPIPKRESQLYVEPIDQISTALNKCRFVFSAVDSDTAQEYEEQYAAAGLPVISNASYHRQTADVPILIPEVNASHLSILPMQQKKRGWKKGFIVTKPNCSIQSYMIPLAALHETFQVQKIWVTTMQAVSGAGYPGIPSWDICENIVPYIAEEEEKSENEPLKIFGSILNHEIVPTSQIHISAHCNRVPVLDGHLACVSVKFSKTPSQEEILAVWNSYAPMTQTLQLPSAPQKTILYRKEPNRPQPRLDRDVGKGMSITVGRLRPCNLLDFRFVALSHNTLRGAAGGGILNAELLFTQRYLS